MLNKYIKINSLSPYQKFPKPPIQIPVPLQNPLIHHSTTLQHPNIFILPLLNHPPIQIIPNILPLLNHPIHPFIHPLIHSSQIHPSSEGAHPFILFIQSIPPLLNHPIILIIHSSNHPNHPIHPFILFFLHPLPSDFRLLTSDIYPPLKGVDPFISFIPTELKMSGQAQ